MSDGKSLVLLQSYRAHCAAVTMNMEHHRSGSWGVDFVSSYITLLKAESDDHTRNSRSPTVFSDESSEFPMNSSSLDEVLTDLEAEVCADSLAASENRSPVNFYYDVSDSFIEEKMSAIQEVIWPLYATYCSCGDSHTPGRLSGPNLVAVLCKLNAVSERLTLSDVGILVHLISAHSFVPSKLDSRQLGRSSQRIDFPSLSYEEFLVFLCTFSQTIYETTAMHPPVMKDTSQLDYINWFKSWQPIIVMSPALDRLLTNNILPNFTRCPNLHNIEDSRYRDRLVLLFSIEILLHIQTLEHQLKNILESLRIIYDLDPPNLSAIAASSIENMIDLFSQIKVVPYLLPAESLALVVKDLYSITKDQSEILVQSKWSYLVAVVAYECVEKSLMYSSYLCSVEVRIFVTPSLSLIFIVQRMKQLICLRLTSLVSELSLHLQLSPSMI